MKINNPTPIIYYKGEKFIRGGKDIPMITCRVCNIPVGEIKSLSYKAIENDSNVEDYVKDNVKTYETRTNTIICGTCLMTTRADNNNKKEIISKMIDY